MNDYMSALYDYISENTPPLRDDPEYDRAVKAYMEIEAEVKEKIGPDLLQKYQCAEGTISRKWEMALFSQALRFGGHFMMEVLR